MTTVISVENLTKKYDLGVIGTGTLSRDLNRWWARLRHQPDPYTKIGKEDPFKRIGESILALDDVSFTVQQGEALGIIGKNGAGKSTLLKILSRVTAPTIGVVKIMGRIGSLLEVGTGFHPELTGRENVFLNGAVLGMRKDEVQKKFDEIVDFSGVEKFIDTPVKRYSSGMYVRLAFAVAAHLDPEILVVDEVLAVGDAEFQKKCLGKMSDVAGEGRTVLFVSHNMEAIQNLCNRCLLLNDGVIMLNSDPFSSVSSYLRETTHNHFSSYGDGVIYIAESEYEHNVMVSKIELLDKDSMPIKQIKTWDAITIRVHIESTINIDENILVVDIWNSRNQRIAVFDTGRSVNLKVGSNQYDCLIPGLYLSSGMYNIGFGVADKSSRWLQRKTNISPISILENDVFNINRPPKDTRMVVAIPHSWNKIK